MRVLKAREVPDKFCRELSVLLGGFGGKQSAAANSSGSGAGFWRGAGRTLRLFEKALRRFGARHRFLPPCLLRASPLALAGTLASPRFLLRSRRSLDTVTRRQADLQLDYLVPDGIGALVVWNCQQLAQATSRIRCLRFIANRRRLLLVGHGVCYRLLDGLFFIHYHIIARIIGSVPELLVVPDLMWGFLATAAELRF